jgi:two-component system, LytTR family, sensor kinase
METIKFNKIVIKRHLLNWILVMIIRNIITPFGDAWEYRTIQTFITLFMLASGYYFFCIIISPIIESGKWKKYLILIIIYFVIWIYLMLLSQRIIGITFESSLIPVDLSKSELAYDFVYVCLMAMLSHGFYKKQISIQRLNEQSEKEQIGLMQETLFFKNQFNSHISLNFLSYCYANAINKDKKTGKAIETYSEMMKYTLHTEASEKVSLNKEVAYIEQFIELQKQIGNDVEVKFNKMNDLAQIKILPRILVNYVENAFKYGITDDPEKPVVINLNKLEKHLVFSISNFKKDILVKHKSTGTGHSNSKMQLDLYYPNKYKVEIIDSKYEYTCHLKIKIN